MRQIATVPKQKWLIVALLMVLLLPFASSAGQEQNCTSVRIELNDRPLALPERVTFIVPKRGPSAVVRVENGCFQLPKLFASAKSFDVLLRTEKDEIHLVGMKPSDFSVGWKIVLKDDATSGPFAAFKNVPANEVCVLEFDPDRDGAAMAQTHCRSPIVAKSAAGASPTKGYGK